MTLQVLHSDFLFYRCSIPSFPQVIHTQKPGNDMGVSLKACLCLGLFFEQDDAFSLPQRVLNDLIEDQASYGLAPPSLVSKLDQRHTRLQEDAFSSSQRVLNHLIEDQAPYDLAPHLSRQ
jgi:hypothetical protein